MTIEKLRLAEARDKKTAWKKSGPYFSERQWGTVREDGDNGAGLGASHQTGWTGLVAKFNQIYGSLDAKKSLEGGQDGEFQDGRKT